MIKSNLPLITHLEISKFQNQGITFYRLVMVMVLF
jgi:hypothetical protein